MDLSFASAAVLAAVQGLLLEDAQALIAERNQPVVPDAQQSRTIQRGGPPYRLRVSAVAAQQRSRSMEVLLELLPGESPPYEIRWRKYGLAGSVAADAADA